MSYYSKLIYFLISLKKFLNKKGLACPSCGSKDAETVDKKYIITTLKRCKSCMILYRTPSTSASENKIFYQEKYSQGFTTDCPNDEKLNELISTNFKNTVKDYSKYIKILNILNNKINVQPPSLFDYGCSWGYGSYQLKKKFNVDSYEISSARAKYAREKLNINVVEEFKLNSLSDTKKFNIFFMSHVLEHTPSPLGTLNFGLKLVKKNGFLISFTPNGSMESKKNNPNWSKEWGMVHPYFIDEKFYQKFFSDNFFYIGSADHEYNLKNIENFVNSDQSYVDDLSKNELMIIVKKN